MDFSHHPPHDSDYIGSIRALSAYYDDEDDDERQQSDEGGRCVPSSPLPFAVDDAESGRGTVCSSPRPEEEEGIVILSSPEEEDEDEEYSLQFDTSPHGQTASEPLDSIIAAAAAHVERQPTPPSAQFQSRPVSSDAWMERAERGQIAHSPPSSSRSPLRATQLRPNQFVVQLDLLPRDGLPLPRLHRRVLETLTDVQLLHLWFDPVSAVLESTVLDGSGSYSPPSERPSRHRDGEWIQIATPPLRPPRDSRVSTCGRRVRVGVRCALGFPERVRSILLVERNAGRMGMTAFCGGMEVHRDWSVKREGGRVVVLEEVRLDPCEEGERRCCFYCCFCVIWRWCWRLVEWMLIRWCRPDLASYMAQTIASLEKLRMLIEDGVVQESAAMEGRDWEGGDNADWISAPLLG